MTGKLYGLGVGPGDPELLTLKALRLLKACPVVAYPAPEQGEAFARTIISSHLEEGVIELPIRMPLDVKIFPAQEAYDEAVPQISAHLEAGRDVAVVCEGDPFFYGSFMYLYGRLADDYEVEVVPGVSSLMACAAALGAPLSARNDVLTILPAPLEDAALEARLKSTDAVAIMKVGRHFTRIRDLIERLELLDQARYIERATLDTQKHLPLAEVMQETAPYFSMILLHRRGNAWKL